MASPLQHASLSPSSAARWSRCPASVSMSEGVPRRDTPATLRGTALHSASEALIRRGAGQATEEEFGAEKEEWLFSWGDTVDWGEAEEEVSTYVDEVLSRLFSQGRDRPGTLMLETRVSPPVEGCWGTSDAIVLSPSGSHLHVLDLKTGRVQVSPEDNPQALLYASGALAALSPVQRARVTKVTLTIVQSPVRKVRDWTIAPWEVDHKVGRLAAAADRVHEPDPPCVPGEVQCHWCPAKGKCAAYSAWQSEKFFGPVGDTLPRVDSLTDADLSKMLSRAQAATDWLKALKEEAEERVSSSGAPLPGTKVRRTTRRRIKNQDAALDALRQAGYDEAVVTRTQLVGIPQLTRLAGSADLLDLILGDSISHETTTSVVPE